MCQLSIFFTDDSSRMTRIPFTELAGWALAPVSTLVQTLWRLRVREKLCNPTSLLGYATMLMRSAGDQEHSARQAEKRGIRGFKSKNRETYFFESTKSAATSLVRDTTARF